MTYRRLSLIALLFFGLALFAVACGGGKEPETVPQPPEPAAPPVEEPVVEEPPVEVTEKIPTEKPVVEEMEPTIAELNASGVLKTVYFDFDKSDLTDATRRTLRANADWLNGHPKYNVVVEGHCDERGTIEYNLALGQRRARAVEEYLAGLGVGRERMRSKSYGEERPAVPGHDEAAWAKNRRAEFVIE